MPKNSNFRRVVLGLQQRAPAHGLRVAAEVAALLQVQLCGLFVQENELSGLAALPFAREFRPLGEGWRSIDQDELSRELEAAARRAQRSFAEAAKGLDLSWQFEVISGSLSETIASVSRAGDIIVVCEPTSPADRVTLQFQAMIRAALGSAAAVMLVPQDVVRQTGAVVALVRNPYDPSVAPAAAIAQLAKEELIVVETFKGGSHGGGSTMVAAPIRAKRMSVAESQLLNATGISTAFTGLQERLLVLTRDDLDDTMAARIASTRRIPVLIIEAGDGGS